ncbi:hypothetical protein [Xanthomonas campestris]|uniref:hypothetical protein n=1 Tax=Xanthomonas campestris TaxID=339 RepID=UPI001E4C7345|nr:hypothetical protein [Xanthomonas campestris]MCC4602447.1 hypothetical protein [Xanthomonas campestris pv. parthenii]
MRSVYRYIDIDIDDETDRAPGAPCLLSALRSGAWLMSFRLMPLRCGGTPALGHRWNPRGRDEISR